EAGEAIHADHLTDEGAIQAGDDGIHLRDLTTPRIYHELAERAKEATFGSGSENRGRHTTTHHVTNDDIEAGRAVIDDIVKIAIDDLRRQGECGNRCAFDTFRNA